MSTGDASPIAAPLADDLACPDCGYSLRGLEQLGPVVTCPECGRRCELEALRRDALAARQETPGIGELMCALAWAIIAGPICAAVTLGSFASGTAWLVSAAPLCIWFAVWLMLCLASWRQLGVWWGGFVVLLGQLAGVVMLGALVPVCASFAGVFVSVSERQWDDLARPLLGLLISGAAFVGAGFLLGWVMRTYHRVHRQRGGVSPQRS